MNNPLAKAGVEVGNIDKGKKNDMQFPIKITNFSWFHGILFKDIKVFSLKMVVYSS